MKWNQSILLLLVVVVLAGCIAEPLTDSSRISDTIPPPEIAHSTPAIHTYVVVNSYPHDPSAFTQGLVIEKGIVYEGTGLYGQSTLRRVELQTGHVLQMRELPAQYFGEGITIYGSKIVQLTWQSGIGFVYDKDSFELVREFHYPYEGWGITYDGRYLMISDGTALLHFLDPETLTEIRKVEVYDANGAVTQLNELEYVQGQIYANVWQTNRIAKIAPETGQITGWLDLEGLLSSKDYTGSVNVLNGIAYDSRTGSLLVTGKLWPKLFEIREIPAK